MEDDPRVGHSRPPAFFGRQHWTHEVSLLASPSLSPASIVCCRSSQQVSQLQPSWPVSKVLLLSIPHPGGENGKAATCAPPRIGGPQEKRAAQPGCLSWFMAQSIGGVGGSKKPCGNFSCMLWRRSRVRPKGVRVAGCLHPSFKLPYLGFIIYVLPTAGLSCCL